MSKQHENISVAEIRPDMAADTPEADFNNHSQPSRLKRGVFRGLYSRFFKECSIYQQTPGDTYIKRDFDQLLIQRFSGCGKRSHG
jgi:hypothetical protein